MATQPIIAVKDGYAEYSLRLDGMVLNGRSPSRVDDGARHSVGFTKRNEKTEIVVDEGEVRESVAQESRDLRAKTTNLFIGTLQKSFSFCFLALKIKCSIGGMPGDMYDTTGGLYSEGFSGCIHAVYVRKRNYGMEIDFANGDTMVRKMVGISCEETCSV